MDGVTYSRIYNASQRAMNDNQNGHLQRTIGNETVNNDNIINKAIRLQPKVEDFKGWYWCETSGAIEDWFKKYNGYPIPNEFASTLIGIGDIVLDEDGVHYYRNIGINEGKTKKIIYGFKDENLYNRILEEEEKFIDFKNVINTSNMNESILNYPRIIFEKYMTIDYLDEIHNQRDINELTPSLYNILNECVSYIEKYGPEYKENEYYVETGKDLLDNCSILKLNII